MIVGMIVANYSKSFIGETRSIRPVGEEGSQAAETASKIDLWDGRSEISSSREEMEMFSTSAFMLLVT